jgi:CBS domain-containing protein
MEAPIHVCASTASLLTAATEMETHNVGCRVVTDEDQSYARATSQWL